MFFLRFVKCEPPSSFYSRPASRPFQPTIPPLDSYGPPAPSNSYGLPALEYGPPLEAETPPPIITKHVYIHIPPPEPDYNVEIPKVNAVQPVQKHYRIIFIKAPTMAIPTAPPVGPATVSEEKTIVYVLVKKPDALPPITAPTPVPTPPSKPEVYFIRYKTEERTTTAPEIEPPNGNGGYYRKKK